MTKFILGKKLGMTTIYEEDGAKNVTLVECGAKVSLIRTKEKDGYSAVQLKVTGKGKKKEFRIDTSDLKEGASVDVSVFEVGEKVNASAIAKAKGFQGVVKRHGFAGSPASHGHKHDLRAPGAIGSGYPEHVIKGKRMAGRMGGKRSTMKNIKIIHIDKDKNLLALEGAVPGNPGVMVEIRGV
jgi:large subunit ribosomal protein L3